MTAHTKGALRAAEAIMNDKHKIRTDYGEKTVYGIADLIERETGLPELLEACKDILEWIDVSGLASTKSGGSGVLAYNGTEYNVVTQLRQAISKAEGRE